MAELGHATDTSAVGGDDRVDQRQAKAVSRTVPACIRPIEALEDMRQIPGGNPDARITDRQANGLVLRLETHGDFAAGRRELERIVEQIAQNLLQFGLVAR